mgnify:CR=1 FL=1
MKNNRIKYYILFVISAAMIFSLIPMDINFSNNPKIGVVTIDEPIMSSREVISQLNKFNKDDDIQGIIVRLNTPGGVVAPSQEIYEKVNLFQKAIQNQLLHQWDRLLRLEDII